MHTRVSKCESTQSSEGKVGIEGYLSKKSIHINESFVHAIALALW